MFIRSLKVLAVLVALLAGGCAELGSQSGDAAESTELSRPVVTGMQNFAVNWGHTVSGMFAVIMTVEAPRVDNQAIPEVPGNAVVYCAVTIANDGQYPFDYRIQDFVLLTDGEMAPGGGDSGSLVTVSVPPLPSTNTLQPGETVQGTVAFELTTDEVERFMQLRFSHLRPGEGSWESVWGTSF